MKKFTWHFIYSKRFSFYPPDYYTIGLGGSESVLVLLTKYLATLNQEVHVFNACFKPGVYDGVHWHLLTSIESAPSPDICVAVRFEDSVVEPIQKAKVNFFWMLDNRANGVLKFIKLNLQNSKIIIASEAMSSILINEKVPMRSIYKILHPIEIGNTDYQSQKKRKLVCLYSSMPNRGLDIVLSCWPDIQVVNKKAELWITNGYVPWGFTDEEAKDKYKNYSDKIEKMQAEGFSIKYLGVLEKNEFYNMLNEVAVLFYPSRFPEMFCLIAAECSMCRIPIVTSNFFALKERVKHGVTGYLINGDINNLATKKQFIDKVVFLLKNSELRDEMGSNSQIFAQESESKNVANKWFQVADSMIK